MPIARVISQNEINRFYYAADTDLEVYVVPSKQVTKMLIEQPEIMLALLQRVNRGLEEFLGRALSLMAGSALSRVVYEIFVEARRFGIEEQGGAIFVELNERGIAARTGLTRETVNREIRKLKHLGAVSVERRGLLVKDVSLLEKKLYKELL